MEPSALFTAVVDGDTDVVLEEVRAMVASGVRPEAILQEHLLPAMEEVGRLYDEGDYFVPELMISSEAMKGAMEELDPLLKAGGVQKLGRVVIGTVSGDMHDIGKNLVAAMLEGNGFDVTDLGVDVSPKRFVETARALLDADPENAPVLVLLSALLTTTMPQMKTVVELVAASGLKEKIRVLIGGAPVTQGYADSIGADGYSDSAYSAVKLARGFFA